MESKDYKHHINFTDAERTESFVLCALQALRTAKWESGRCGIDIATRPELCLMRMQELFATLASTMRLSMMGDYSYTGQVDILSNDLVAMALALRSGAMKAMNSPRESRYVQPQHRRWHLCLTGSIDAIFDGSLHNVIHYADDVLRPHGEARDDIEIREVVLVHSSSSMFYVSDVISNMSRVVGDQDQFPQETIAAINDEDLCASLQASVGAVIGQFLPFKSYQYGRTCILSNLSEVDGKYVDKSNGMVLGEIAQ